MRTTRGSLSSGAEKAWGEVAQARIKVNSRTGREPRLALPTRVNVSLSNSNPAIKETGSSDYFFWDAAYSL